MFITARKRTTSSSSATTFGSLPQETPNLHLTAENPVESQPQQTVQTLEEVQFVEISTDQPNAQYIPTVTYLPTEPVQFDELQEDREYTLFTLQPIPVTVDATLDATPAEVPIVTLEDLQFAPGIKSKGRPSKRKGVTTQTSAKKRKLQ